VIGDGVPGDASLDAPLCACTVGDASLAPVDPPVLASMGPRPADGSDAPQALSTMPASSMDANDMNLGFIV
jgi:hypothetical protein